MIELFYTGIVIGFLVSCPIGPIGMLSIQRTLSKGQLSGFITGLGAAFSDLVYAAGTSLFVGLLVNFVKANERPLQIFGSIIMILIGFFIFRSNPVKKIQPNQDQKQTHIQDFITAFLVTFSNVFIVLLFIGLFAQYGFVLPEHSIQMTIIGLLGVFAGAALWWFLLTFVVSLLRRWFNIRGLKILNKAMGSVIMGLAVFAFVTALGGCVSKEKKEAENTPAPAAKVKNFERPIPPVIMTSPQDRAGFMIAHYWDKFEFTDTMYCHAPEITEQAFVDFLALFPYATNSKVTEGVKNMLDAAEADETMYNYFFRLAGKYLYEPNSRMHNDEFYIPFLEHVVASHKVSEEHKIRTQHFLQLAYRNRTGSKAEDIVFTTASGSTGRLYNISAPYLLLMFFNPDCAECKKTTDELKKSAIITAAVASGMLKILAVYPDENIEIWREHLQEIPPSWINGYDETQVIKTHEVYDLKAIPTLYLLDENKKVILKDTHVDYLNDYLSKITSSQVEK